MLLSLEFLCFLIYMGSYRQTTQKDALQGERLRFSASAPGALDHLLEFAAGAFVLHHGLDLLHQVAGPGIAPIGRAGDIPSAHVVATVTGVAVAGSRAGRSHSAGGPLPERRARAAYRTWLCWPPPGDHALRPRRSPAPRTGRGSCSPPRSARRGWG